MGDIKDQVRSEIRQLPFMLGKLIGAIMAVIGFPGAIVVAARRANPAFSDLLPYLFMGISGVAVFLLSSRLLTKRIDEEKDTTPQKNKYLISTISWLIFSALAAIFLLITYLVTR